MFQSKVPFFFFVLLFSSTTYLFSQPFNNDKIIDTTTVGLVSQNSGEIDVDKNGRLGITWIDFAYQGYYTDGLFFASSTDHGETFSKTLVDSGAHIPFGISLTDPKMQYDHEGNIWLFSMIYFELLTGIDIYKSIDGGQTFQTAYLPSSLGSLSWSFSKDTLNNVFILWKRTYEPFICTKFKEGVLSDTSTSVIPLPGSNLNIFNVAAETDGRNIYSVFSAGENNKYKIYLVKSTDGGVNFTVPVKIDSSVADSINQISPAIAFWNNKICISWIDNRSGSKELFYTETSDGGTTFSQVKKISEQSNVESPYLSANPEMLNMIWYSDGDTYFSFKGLQSDTFSVPTKVGDPLYQNFDQVPLSITADENGYTYILFYDYRVNSESRLFLSSAKFTMTDINEEDISTPHFFLYPNYPNPFNPVTTFKFSLPASDYVTLKIYDILGREVTTVVNEMLNAGEHKYNFDASGLSSGVYFYRLSAGNFSAVKKLILMK
jgi:hypothetical protein